MPSVTDQRQAVRSTRDCAWRIVRAGAVSLRGRGCQLRRPRADAARPVSRAGAVADLHRSSCRPIFSPGSRSAITGSATPPRFLFSSRAILRRSFTAAPCSSRGFVVATRAHPETGLADLCRARAAVHDLSCRSLLRRDQPRESAVSEGNGDHWISSSQPGVTMVQALLLRYRPVNMDVLPLYIVLMFFLPLDPADDEAARQRHSGDVGRCFTRCPGGTICTWRPIRTVSGRSIPLPGNCCSCSAPGARWAAPGGCRALCRRQSRCGSLLRIWPRRSA